jgi:hypothetical protein
MDSPYDFMSQHFMQSNPKRAIALCKRQYYWGDQPDDLRCGKCDRAVCCRDAVTGSDNNENSKDVME